MATIYDVVATIVVTAFGYVQELFTSSDPKMMTVAMVSFPASHFCRRATQSS